MGAKKVIDISGWQEGISFKEIKDAKIRGVIVKISEGYTPEDTWWNYVSECEK